MKRRPNEEGGTPVKRIFCILLMLMMLPAGVLAAEGDPLLSVDDLLSLEESYAAFLG